MLGLMPGPLRTPSLVDHYDPDLGSGRLAKVQPSPVMPGACPTPRLFQDTKWTPSNTTLLFSPLPALCWSLERAGRRTQSTPRARALET